MLGLGSNMIKHPVMGKSIVRDNLVLQHNYTGGAVQPLSDGAAYFVESNTDYISVSDAASLSFDACSFSAWIFVTDATDFPIIGKGVYNSTAEYQLKVQSDDKIHFWVADESVASCHIGRSTPTITSYENQWIHVAGTYDGGTASSGLKIYINGVQVDSANDEANAGSFVAMENLGADVEIGKYSSTYGDGYICNVGIWDAVLSQAQIKSIMWKNYAGLTSSEKTDLVSWWNLDSVIPDTTTFVYDNHHDDGDTLGSELVTNGDFTNGLTGWTKGTPASTTMTLNSENQMVMTESGEPSTYLGAFTPIDLTEGNTYIFQYDVISSDNVSQLRVGTAGPSVDQYSHSNILYTGTNPLDGTPPTTKIVYFVADSSQASDNYLYIGGRDDVDSLVVDNVSLKLVNGNTGTLA